MNKLELVLIMNNLDTGKTERLRILDPIDGLERDDVEGLATVIMTSGIFGDVVPVSAQIIETTISEMDLD